MDHSEQEKLIRALKGELLALNKLLDAADRTPFGDMGQLLDRMSGHAATAVRLTGSLEQEAA